MTVPASSDPTPAAGDSPGDADVADTVLRTSGATPEAPSSGQPPGGQAGRPFGRYRLLGELGRGGMGVVYRAWDTRLNRVVALKQILSRGAGDSVRIDRFLREARLAAAARYLYQREANYAELERRVGDAKALIERAVARAPHVALGHYLLGRAWRLLGWDDRAEACWNEAVRLDPQLARAHYQLGMLHLDAAIADYDRALAIDPRCVGAIVNRGNALRDKGDLAGALAVTRASGAPPRCRAAATRSAGAVALGPKDCAGDRGGDSRRLHGGPRPPGEGDRGVGDGGA